MNRATIYLVAFVAFMLLSVAEMAYDYLKYDRNGGMRPESEKWVLFPPWGWSQLQALLALCAAVQAAR